MTTLSFYTIFSSFIFKNSDKHCKMVKYEFLTMKEKAIMAPRLTIKSIYEKSFKSKMRGYDPVEVDEFLDMIMQDYEYFEKEIMSLKKQLAARPTVSPAGPAVSKTPTQQPTEHIGNTNFDILRRISNLEKHVFGSKIDAE